MSPKQDDDTDPNIQATGAQRVVVIAQQAVEDVERELGGALPTRAGGMIAHHLGQTFDLGREYEREKTIEERRAKEKLERDAKNAALEAEIAISERDRRIAMLERRVDRLTRSRATKR